MDKEIEDNIDNLLLLSKLDKDYKKLEGRKQKLWQLLHQSNDSNAMFQFRCLRQLRLLEEEIIRNIILKASITADITSGYQEKHR